MILYSVPLSSYCVKVRLCLALKGVLVELKFPPGGYRSREYKEIVSSGTVPALVDGDFILAESDTIIEYINERFPEPKLLPDEPQARARARYLGRIHDLHLEPRVRAQFGLVGSESVEGQAKSGIASKLDLIERHLDAVGPFAVSARPTLADCAFPATLAIIDAFEEVFGWNLIWGPRTRRWRGSLDEVLEFRTIIEPYRDIVASWISEKKASKIKG